MIIDIKEGVFEVNTSEAYNKEIFFHDNNMIIPYINLEIFDSKLTQIKMEKCDKLDFSYLIIKGVKNVSWNYEYKREIKDGELVLDNFSNINDYLLDYVTGANLFTGHSGCEFKIRFKEQYLFFFHEVGVKNGPLNFWIPIDTPNFRKNMDEKDVQFFFTKDSIPIDALNLVGISDSTMLKTLDVLKFNVADL
ncbi:hypothetical protein [Chryseobacterium rhizosphaerae]|uniref:hypothetical protein n=1 Tax=Chryseobacterium rhizosphaerae TaxID=395937 RepID=UPI003D132810